MDVSVTGSTRGGVRHLTILVSATDRELVSLIDSLASAGGYPEIVAGKITKTVGLVDVPSNPEVDWIRALRQIANDMERELS